jgi:hypothetical protein
MSIDNAEYAKELPTGGSFLLFERANPKRVKRICLCLIE